MRAVGAPDDCQYMVSNPGYFRYTIPVEADVLSRAIRGKRPLPSEHIRRISAGLAAGRARRPTARLDSPSQAYTFKGVLKPATRQPRCEDLRLPKAGGKYVIANVLRPRERRDNYYASVKLPYKGTWRLRAYHATDDYRYKTYSDYRYVTVK